jgi:hypothetical protein
MLEVTSYGLKGMVAILLLMFCFACKDEFASFTEGPSSSPMYDAELRHPKTAKRSTGAANSDPAQQGQKHAGALHG